MSAWSIRIAALPAVMALVAASALGAASDGVDKIRIAAASGSTRVVLDLKRPVGHTVFTLSNPARVVVDLHGTTIDAGNVGVPGPTGVVKRVRLANRDNGDARVVLDLAEPARPRSFPVPPDGNSGHRLVIDLERLGAGRVVKSAPEGERGRNIVVALDAGHGGKDPGAVGRRGTREKDVVLQIVRRLKARIDREPGMEAYLTRDGDYFVPLRERIERARRQRADLFVSVHADAFKNRGARGSSVYVLSPRGATDEAARWLAARENAADLVGGVSLDDKDAMLASVLLDLSQTAAIDASVSVADQVLSRLGKVGRLHRSSVGRAGFLVLKSPDIPSILVETAFISNPDEEVQLKNARHQEALAGAIVDGIRAYFYDNPPPGTLLAVEGPPVRTRSVEHIIVRGETLSGIASRYNVSLSALRRHNRLKNDRIRIGQVLQIPAARGS
ncbi:MAG: N-acetylmuramoyl-L-alanine amidase [Gammaproteobacteria bacterium]|jgi:N-acetylmuramoyl-L-alanine amidase